MQHILFVLAFLSQMVMPGTLGTLSPTSIPAPSSTPPTAVIALPATPPTIAFVGGFGCSDAPPARLAIGMRARVTFGNPNSLRPEPGLVGTRVIGKIPGGGEFIVIGGPACGAGMRWWQVNYNGQVGWTSEGLGTTYWLEPLRTGDNCAGILPTRLQVGGAGRVPSGMYGPLYSWPIPDLNNVAAIIGGIPANDQFTVLAGPHCVNNQTRWWQVNYRGTIGWTIEATPTLYWLEPANDGTGCGYALPARLWIGGYGRVTPGLPNHLRTGPNTVGTWVIGLIPGGGPFIVVGGPACGAGMRWWQVSYNGQVGWTPEGQGTTYWLEPL